MNSAFKSFAVAGGVMLAGVLAGCGWFSGDDDDARDGARPVSSPLDNVTRMHLIPPTPPSSFDPPFDNILGAAVAYGLYPSGVAPDCGPFAGGTPVTISGDFSIIPAPLTAAQAAAAYWVYFGGVLGSFDATFDPNTVTSTEFHVITPSAPATGPVDVTIISFIDGYYGNLVDAYTYYEPFELMDVVPPSGPALGGNSADVNADPINHFPIHQPITTAAQAALYYRVLFDGNVATFDDTSGDPVTDDYMRVFVPAGTAGDFVDVTVEEIGSPCNTFTLTNGYQYLASLLSITEVYPQYGYVKGGLDVEVRGSFDVPVPLNAADAAANFEVRFGGVAATFREVAGVAMDSTTAYVVTPVYFPPVNPPNNGKETVDVELEQLMTMGNVDALYDSFTYVAIDILAVTPTTGVSTGGVGVKISAFLSIDDAMLVDTAAEAYAAYAVYFGDPALLADRATFDSLFSPVIEPPTNDIPNPDAVDALQTAAQMYVLEPPHTPATVDVWVIDLPNAAIPVQDVLNNSYTYTAPGLGTWIGVEVIPEVIGELDQGELQVRIETTSAPADWNNINVFLVPQGGDSADPNHRIPLEFVSETTGTQGSIITTWRNADDIRRWVFDEDGSTDISPGDIFADGHAAIMIEDAVGIFGDDAGDPSDGGLINFSATISDLFDPQVYRHVTIDTIPPILQPATNPARGGNLVTLDAGSLGDLGDILPLPASQFHPVVTAGAGVERNSSNLVDSEDEIEAGVYHPIDDPDTRAQVFLNTASDEFTNDFPADELDITIDVTLYDPHLYEYYEDYAPLTERFTFTPNAATDGNFFLGGDTTRYPSGFRSNPLPSARLDETVADSLSGGSTSDWVQWRLAPGSDRIPASLRADVSFTLGGTLTIPIVPHSENSTELTATIDFDTTTQSGGIPEPSGSSTLHWALYFLGHDTAGWVLNNLYWENGGSATPDIDRRILTPASTFAGPLHIWWIRNTSARLAPSFEGADLYDETIRFELNRGFTIPLDTVPALDVEPRPVYAYRLWRSTVPGRGGYDAEYVPLEILPPFWEPFSDVAQIAVGPASTAGTIAADYPEALNHWVLIQALAIDEAGNYGQFPDTELDYDYEGLGGTGNILEFFSGSGASWTRFFLLEDEFSVDTRIRTTVWYDRIDGTGTQGVIDPGERVIIGGPTVVQAPDDIALEQIRIRFQIQPIVGELDPEFDDTDIDWTATRRNTAGADTVNGTQGMGGLSTINLDFARQLAGPNVDIGVDLDDTESGAAAAPFDDGGTTTLVFRFRTHFDAAGADIVDSSPATYSVTVVDDIEEFVENRETRDNQPIKETSR